MIFMPSSPPSLLSPYPFLPGRFLSHGELEESGRLFSDSSSDAEQVPQLFGICRGFWGVLRDIWGLWAEIWVGGWENPGKYLRTW